MTQQRLCKSKKRLFPAAMELVQRGDFSVRFQLDELKCPRGRDHCDPREKCLGMHGENRQRIEEIKDRLFRAGFVRLEEIR